MKALAAGKHVLLEKPSSNSAEDTQKMFEFAESKGLVLLEAFHYRYGNKVSVLQNHLIRKIPDSTPRYRERKLSLTVAN